MVLAVVFEVTLGVEIYWLREDDLQSDEADVGKAFITSVVKLTMFDVVVKLFKTKTSKLQSCLQTIEVKILNFRIICYEFKYYFFKRGKWLCNTPKTSHIHNKNNGEMRDFFKFAYFCAEYFLNKKSLWYALRKDTLFTYS